MAKTKLSKQPSIGRKLLPLVIGALVLYVVVPQLGNFKDAIVAIERAEPGWLVVVLAASCMTYLAAGLMYQLLAQQRLRFWSTFIVQLAGNFTNRLLPAGIGAATISYHYLRLSKHTKTAAVTVVSMNNLLGFIGNVCLVLLLLGMHARVAVVHMPHVSRLLLAGIIGAVTVICLLLSRYYAKRLKVLGRLIARQLIYYRQRPVSIITALMVSMLLTLGFAGALYASAQAVHLPVSFPVALIIMTLGVAGSTVTPTPGGLGGAEAGLVAGFVAYGSSAATALAAVLIYRLCTFWLSIPLGALAFVYARKRRYI